MAMRIQYGKRPKKQDGFYKPVSFPNMATLDKWTSDGRMIESAGFGTRDLPQPIRLQYADNGGHSGSVPVGALHELSVNEDGVLSGAGWLIDTDDGRMAAFLLHTQALRGNSIELADVVADIDLTEDFDLRIRFTEANFAGTCLVGRPAFGDAFAELDDDEITAALADVDEIVADVSFTPTLLAVQPDEIVASGLVQPWADFHIPEADRPTKVIVDEEGRVFGHLALWDSCHDGVEGQCLVVPRPTDNYASFNKPGVLTELGIVETGPIFLTGGHPRKRLGDSDPVSAYGGIENAWADVRVIPGRFGPWLSGRVRPGVSDDQVYAARASRVSGHWVRGRLKAIVSVNAEGYDVPGSGFSVRTEGDQVTELVASFPPCANEAETPESPVSNDVLLETRRDVLRLQLDMLDG
jgi:hypothetical protein